MFEDWLMRHARGYAELSPEERDAITGFMHLWGLFEGQLLDERANPAAIVEAAGRWAGDGLADSDAVREALSYFRDRYFPGGVIDERFENLVFRPNDCRPLVEAVMAGTRNRPADVIAAVLIIIYRLRNNLFHGLKWHYGIAGQYDNFRSANQVLIAILGRYQAY